MTSHGHLDPMFLSTRETFPGEKTFHELACGFFAHGTSASRAAKITALWSDVRCQLSDVSCQMSAVGGLLVHMANPEQLDDLFAHIAREKRVRYLSTTYLQRDIRTSVYAIGRGTGLLLDPSAATVEHVSVNDCDSETDHLGRLDARDDQRVSGIAELRAALLERARATSFANDVACDDWNEVNVSFEGPAPILGFFALDGTLSKLYATALRIKAGGLLPVFTYNREANLLAEFRPTPAVVEALAAQVAVPHLRERYLTLLPHLEKEKAPT